MDFEDTKSEADYRAQVRSWLEANAEDYRNAPAKAWEEDEFVERAKAWQAQKMQAGYVAITWPKEIGGQGGTPIQQVIFSQEESKYHVPLGLFEIGLGMCIPTVVKHGTADHAKRYVPPALLGKEVWCQLFSEPAAGSDLAGIRTKAVRDGDNWVINGQKVWTSWGHRADYGILITRTDFNVPKHKGMTMFFLDMKSPGVEVRPIKQMSGASNFNEVFFNDVVIPDSQRLGDVGDGWRVSLTTLMNERLAVGGKPSSAPAAGDFVQLAEYFDAVDDGSVKQAIADFYLKDEGVRLTRMRALTALSRGQLPGPEASLGKLVIAKALQDGGQAVMDMAGPAGLIRDKQNAPALDKWQASYIWSAGLRIAGGTDEILRNIIAERVLGLPGDVRVDKDKAFNELPTGKS
ncbi:MAG: acyl-CoA dehydrogenase family protein [Sphingomonadales bacterium]|jgi:alkylation response protein AidB-like acyl-CoA dehydrogenase